MDNNPQNDKDLEQDEPTTLLESELAEAADEAASEQSEPNDLEKSKAEAADWRDKYVRLYAEFDNFRNRTAKEKIALIGTANEDLMKDLLPIVDDFERSLKAMESSTDVNSLKEGVNLVFHKLMKTMNQRGLQAVESIGKPFNSDHQEAITQIPVEDPAQKGMVVDEIEKGYQLRDKTIRHAKVVIGA